MLLFKCITKQLFKKDYFVTNDRLLMSTLKDTEKMALTVRKLEEALKDAHKEREKALQELSRLKQHLLEKVNSLPIST